MEMNGFPNPYDFANPVADEILFVGREQELKDIRYYLDHARAAPRPINLAILGPRASGKTSLLNMTELEARRRNFCTVRIDLDEGDARSPLAFFYKLFDGLMTVVLEFGAFGGRQGKTYDTYLELTNSYSVPVDKTFCPFLFPLQYATAMAGGNSNAQLSDNSFKSDLAVIRLEVNRPIAILFDEGNALAGSRVHLEKLRNIFMNTPGYMLILTGTPDLFPVMDDIFSPIVRQFKKIGVGKFDRASETEECIRRPLEKLGIQPETVFDFNDTDHITEIHELAGGRPYEIQLICHVMYRRIQSRQAKQMRLDLGVLEDVRKELETARDITVRPVLTAIRGLGKERFRALNLLCSCDGRASFEQIWSVECIVNGDKPWTKQSLRNELDELIGRGIILVENERLKFAGDEFDRIYTKYVAREVDAVISFPDLPLEIFWQAKLLTKLSKDLTPLIAYMSLEPDLDPVNLASRLAVEDPHDDVFAGSPLVLADVYNLMLEHRNLEFATLIRIELTLPWLRAQSWFYQREPNDPGGLERCAQRIEAMALRTQEFGGNLTMERKAIPVVPAEALARKVESSANEMLRRVLAARHGSKSASEYIGGGLTEDARFYATLSYRYSSMPENATSSNNLGYVFLAAGDLEKAWQLFTNAVNRSADLSTRALANYNRAIVDCKHGRLVDALDKIEACVKLLENSSDATRKMARLFVPRSSAGEVSFEELRDSPDLLQVALDAREILRLLLEGR